MIKLIPLNCMANAFLPLLTMHPVSHDYAINYVIIYLFNLNFGPVQTCKCCNFHSCNLPLASSTKPDISQKKGSEDAAPR